MRPLRGGLKLAGKKEATLVPWTIARPSPPKKVRIPLKESSSGASACPLVQEGSRVRVGEKIAETGGAQSIFLHASISGKVSWVGEAIEIVSDGKDESIPGIGLERPPWEGLLAAEIKKILRDSGIFLPGGSAIDTLILNGCESEPYLTSEHSLMMSHPVEILKAGEILLRTLGAKGLVIALEDNQEEVAELLKSKIFFHSWSGARVELLPARYPQGDERILIRTLLGRKVLPGHSPEEVGVGIYPIASAYAVYEAVVLGKPFYERAVTIAGECVAQPRNFWIRVGTAAGEAVKYAKGFLREPARILSGGPMRGASFRSLDEPVLKTTSGILGLPPEVVRPESVEPCIRCGLCVESCPESISPVMITLAAEKDLFDLAQEYGASFCVECGNCSYVCPAKRPMVELIQYVNAHPL